MPQVYQSPVGVMGNRLTMNNCNLRTPQRNIAHTQNSEYSQILEQGDNINKITQFLESMHLNVGTQNEVAVPG